MRPDQLIISILANDKTKQAFKSVGAGLAKIAKAAAAVVTAGLAFGAALTVSAMKSADALAKTADKIGATTEALAGLQHAAELSGVSTETMNMALQRMTRRVSEAAVGTGEAKAALLELGIDAQKLNQLPLDEQMGQIADAMGDLGNQSDRVRIAMKLFDSEGVALVNTLKGGSAGLAEMAKEAESLGLALSRQDTAKIEEANDQITKATAVFTGLGNQLAVELSPIIAAIATDFRQVAIEENEAGNVGQRLVEMLFKGFGHVGNAILGIKVAVMGIQFVFAKFMQLFLRGIGELAGSFDFLIDKYNAVAEFFGNDTIKNALSEGAIGLSEGFQIEADKIKTAILEAVNSPLPSDQIQAWFDTVQAKAAETAEVVAANAAGMADSTGQKTEEELANQTKLSEFMAKSERDKTAHVIGEANNRFSALGRTNKKMFALQKGMQIAQAMMNTYTSATTTMAQYPFPINVALAALTVANGLAQVAQIRAQSFDGGGFTGFGARAGGVDGKGGFPAVLHPNETVIDHTKGQGMGANVTLNIQANDTAGFDDLLVKRRASIIQIINEALNDNGQAALV